MLCMGQEDLANLLVMVIVLILAHVFGFEINRIKSKSSTPSSPIKHEFRHVKMIGIVAVTYLLSLTIALLVLEAIYSAIFCTISMSFIIYWLLKVIRP